MAGTTKLEIYNNALGHLGSTRLAASGGLIENRPDRREIDAKYTQTLQGCLEEGIWFFALRSIELQADTDVDMRFGLPYAFSLPSDYVRLRAIGVDERQDFEDPSYKREGNYIYSDQPVLYLTYVSNGENYGLNLGAFPQLYTDFVSIELALRSGLSITKDKTDRNDLIQLRKIALANAKRKDAVDERVKYKPLSSWVRARFNGLSRDQRRSPSSTGTGNGE